MGRYAYFADGNDIWREVSESLASSGFEPGIWLGHPRHLDWVRRRFPSCRILDERRLNHGDFQRSFGEPLPFEMRASSRFSRIENAAIYALQRNARFRSIDFLERRAFSSAVCDFLWKQIKDSEVDGFIASQAPHSAAGLLFAGILEALGRQMLHFDQVPIAPRMVPRVGLEFQEFSLAGIPRDELLGLDDDVDLWVDRFCTRLEEQRIAISEERNSRYESDLSGPLGALRMVKYARTELTAILQGYAQSSIHPAPSGLRRATWISSVQAARYKRERLEKLRHEYNLHSDKGTLGSNYWMFLLHFEPEKTTLPNGDLLGDQLYLIRQAAARLPKGTELLVKEHPSQLLSGMNGHVGRAISFYQEVSTIPGVRLLPDYVGEIELMRNAEVIFTVTGTVGIEGSILGRPVVYFGHPWYKNFEGTCAFRDFVQNGGVRAPGLGTSSAGATVRKSLGDFLRNESLSGTISPGHTRYFLDQGWSERADVDAITQVCVLHLGIRSSQIRPML